MRRFHALIPALLLAVLLTPVTRAEAANTLVCSGYSSCQSKGYSNFGYSSKQGTSYWAMYTGTNCTNYVAYRLVATNGMPNTRPKSGVGNARDWGTTMSSITNSTPAIGAVAWWGRKSGRNHVAYIEKVVSSSEIWVSESNWAGAFDWRKITKSGSDWPDGFIHFKDNKLAIVNSADPAVDTGAVEVGTTIVPYGGKWTPSGNTYAYQWKADGTPIPGATTRSWAPTIDQLGKKVSLTVNATRSGYTSATATSPGVTVAPQSFTSTARPVVTGTPQVGSALSATTGSWTPSATSYVYQWYDGSTAIAGATDATYTPTPDRIGATVRARVTAKGTGFAAKNAISVSTAPITPGVFTSTARPVVTGNAMVGSTLSTTTGTWTPSGTYTYQWYDGSAAITGANDATYTPTSDRIGGTIRARVTAKGGGLAAKNAISVSTAPITPRGFIPTARPVVTGRPMVGSTLSATTGSWTPSASSYVYQWYDGSTRISGATSRTFTPTTRQVGATLRARVTAKRTGYPSKNAISISTPAITR